MSDAAPPPDPFLCQCGHVLSDHLPNDPNPCALDGCGCERFVARPAEDY